MNKAAEPARMKTHWDYVLAEMAWLAKDFMEERKWKMALGKKVGRAVVKYHSDLKKDEARRKKDEKVLLRKRAKWIAGEVVNFWEEVGEFIRLKHVEEINKKKKEVMDKNLGIFVGEVQKYSAMVAEEIGIVEKEEEEEGVEEERDFEPAGNESADDESTMLDDVKIENETEMLKRESEIPIDDVLKKEYGIDGGKVEDDDGEEKSFSMESEGADDEATLLEAEALDGDKEEEVNALEKEGDAPLESLIDVEKYRKMAEEEERNEDLEKRRSELEALLDAPVQDKDERKERLEAFAKAASVFQPKGHTLDKQKVKTPVPFLLKHTLRDYQHIGLDWLATMNKKGLNGILADEMARIDSFFFILPYIFFTGFGKNYPNDCFVGLSCLRGGKLGTTSYCCSYLCFAQLGNGV